MKPDIFRTLIYLEPWHILKPCSIQNPVKYIRWSILFRTLKHSIFRLMIHSKPQHIQNSRHSKYCESLKYRLRRTMCNLGIFTTLVYSSSGRLRAKEILKNLSNMYDGLFSTEPCVTLIFRTQGIFRTLSNTYDGKFYSPLCVKPAYLELWHIQNPRHI